MESTKFKELARPMRGLRKRDPRSDAGDAVQDEAKQELTTADIVSRVRYIAAGQQEQEDGLLGWLSLTLNDRYALDGIAVRRTFDGRRALSWPSRRDGAGRQHFLVRPVSDEVREDIEDQVFSALGWTP